MGKLELDYHKTLLSKKSKDQLREFLSKNINTAVKGPDGAIFLLDPPYHILSLPESFNEKIPLNIIANFEDLDGDKFLKKVVKSYGVYEKDRKGRIIRYRDVPNSLFSIKDDPYTSLMLLLLREKDLSEFKEPNDMFTKALRLRDQIPGLKPSSLAELEKFKEKALEVIHEKVLTLDIEKILPTQLCLGQLEIAVKTGYLKSLKENELQAYLTRNFFLGVRDHKKKIHLIDGHHKVRSLLNLGVESIPVTIVEDYSALTESEFWETMKIKKYVYLSDCQGNPAEISDIPKSFEKLGNDTFRSLAWFIRKNKIYVKDGKPFQEFEWADFLRKKLADIELSNAADIEINQKKILDVIYSEEALKLRGHLGNRNRISRINTKIY